MQNERIFAAPSLSEVCKQLLIYRPTGVLTIWRAPGPRQEEARLTIDSGRPLSIFWGSQREQANDVVLSWLNGWGEIHFTFIATEVRLQLPEPSPASNQEATAPTDVRLRQAITRRLPVVTQPLQTMPHTRPSLAPPIQQGQQRELPPPVFQNRVAERSSAYEAQHREAYDNHASQHGSSAAVPSELLVASLTQSGRSFSAANLPRYDRTIFLLVNGRRTIIDLAQLTKRSPEEVYASLQRLRSMQLVTIATPTNQKREK